MHPFSNLFLFLALVPGVGVEPTRISPLVFETSASTGSAIRAKTGGKYRQGNYELGIMNAEF